MRSLCALYKEQRFERKQHRQKFQARRNNFVQRRQGDSRQLANILQSLGFFATAQHLVVEPV